MTCEAGVAAAAARDDRVERARQCAFHRKIGQQHDAGQLRIVGHVIEPGGDHGLACLAIDERCAERRIGVGPADQHGPRDAVAAAFDPRGEKAEQAGVRGDEPGSGRSIRARTLELPRWLLPRIKSGVASAARDQTRPAPTSRPNTGAAACANAGS